jgi:hypothetical protein
MAEWVDMMVMAVGFGENGLGTPWLEWVKQIWLIAGGSRELWMVDGDRGED